MFDLPLDLPFLVAEPGWLSLLPRSLANLHPTVEDAVHRFQRLRHEPVHLEATIEISAMGRVETAVQMTLQIRFSHWGP